MIAQESWGDDHSEQHGDESNGYMSSFRLEFRLEKILSTSCESVGSKWL